MTGSAAHYRRHAHGSNQDTEDYAFIEYTVVVKLTPDVSAEPPSAMRVVGAPCLFEYGPEAGASGSFRASVFHASVAPESAGEHLKIAYFFRRSTTGERRAKRALAAEGIDGDADALSQQRRHVSLELSSMDDRMI